jgi:hypothetical protein
MIATPRIVESITANSPFYLLPAAARFAQHYNAEAGDTDQEQHDSDRHADTEPHYVGKHERQHSGAKRERRRHHAEPRDPLRNRPTPPHEQRQQQEAESIRQVPRKCEHVDRGTEARAHGFYGGLRSHIPGRVGGRQRRDERELQCVLQDDEHHADVSQHDAELRQAPH